MKAEAIIEKLKGAGFHGAAGFGRFMPELGTEWVTAGGTPEQWVALLSPPGTTYTSEQVAAAVHRVYGWWLRRGSTPSRVELERDVLRVLTGEELEEGPVTPPGTAAESIRILRRWAESPDSCDQSDGAIWLEIERLAAQRQATPPGAVDGLRPEVLAFAHLMEETLRQHDAEKGATSWKDCDTGYLMERLEHEAAELEVARGMGGPILEEIARKAAGVANTAMMLVDVCGGLPAVQPPAPATADADDAFEIEESCIAEASRELREAFAAPSDPEPLIPPGTVDKCTALLLAFAEKVRAELKTSRNGKVMGGLFTLDAIDFAERQLAEDLKALQAQPPAPVVAVGAVSRKASLALAALEADVQIEYVGGDNWQAWIGGGEPVVFGIDGSGTWQPTLILVARVMALMTAAAEALGLEPWTGEMP